MIKFRKTLAAMLAVTMVVGLTACGSGNGGSDAGNTPAADTTQQQTTDTPATDQTPSTDAGTDTEPAAEADTRLAAEVYPEEFNVEGWTDESSALYADVLGEFNEYYQKSLVVDSLSERWALMAIAEAKMLESGVFIPLSTRGGNYAISRVAPYTVNSTLWGNDSDRFHQALIADKFIIPADRDEMKAKWAELKGTGTYEQWAKDFLAEKGYTLSDTYNVAMTSNVTTWDALNTSRQADSEAIVHTYDGLMEYDIENVQQPALATGYEVSDDGLTYTFHIREGVQWVDSQGRKIADVKADDFVAGMQHMMDCMAGLEYLVQGIIKGSNEYISGETSDFSTVGVTAPDDYTLVYTLEAPCSFFTTMLGYNVFAPLCRDYYTSQGGKFGEEFSADDASYVYGTDPDHIAYCGPYLVTNYTPDTTIVYEANPTYWNKDNINIKKQVWVFEDGTDATKTYTDAVAGTLAGTGLNTASLEVAKADGNFDLYAYTSATDATTFNGFLNINRKAFANFNDATVAVSAKTVDDAKKTAAAMQNVHFRRALCSSLDRGSYNAQSQGEELKLNNLRNCYTPGTFVFLEEETTVDINGTATTFPAGTFYGAIMQAQIDADQVPWTVWDPTADGGIGSSDGFDGWHNPSYAKSELEAAVAELAAAGIEVSAENPVQIDLPYFAGSEIYTNRANVFKQSFESTLENKVVVNLIPCESADDWYYAGYYPEYGYEMNADMMDVSGWGPDYGDPQTYLDTMLPDYAGYMVKSIGMF